MEIYDSTMIVTTTEAYGRINSNITLIKNPISWVRKYIEEGLDYYSTLVHNSMTTVMEIHREAGKIQYTVIPK